MKCKKGCTEIVHFISPEMSALFDHAIINMFDGSEKFMSITQPRKWRVKGDSFGATPMEAHKPLIEYDVAETRADGVTVTVPRYVTPEIIYNSSYTGIDIDDQYFKDIKAIEKEAERVSKQRKSQTNSQTSKKASPDTSKPIPKGGGK